MTEREFIRIEYRDTGYGMYCNEETKTDISDIKGLELMIKRHEDENRLPNVRNDTIIYRTLLTDHRNWRFCFKSIKNFKQLVKENEIALLKQHGFKVFRIRASNYIKSEYQVIVELESIYQKIEI